MWSLLSKLFARREPKIWVFSDTHFNHKNIIKYSNLPFADLNEMTKTLIKNWNKKIGKKDIVIHCGDFGFGRKSELVKIGEQLNGYKILVMGNHDKHSKTFYKQIFDEVYKGEPYCKEIYGKKVYFIHDPADSVKYGLDPKQDIIFYGHTHLNKMSGWEQYHTYCTCIEQTRLQPVSVQDIMNEWGFYGEEK